MPPANQQESDHDLLIRLDTKMDGIGEAVAKIEAHLSSKADSSDLTALEKRVKDLETTIQVQSNALTAATASANSTVKTLGTAVGWLSGAVTIVHYLVK
jgi:hypothetical protein